MAKLKKQLTTVAQRYNTVWEDFTVADETKTVPTDLSIMWTSSEVANIALNFKRYTGYNKTAYGIPADTDRGMTEQESFDVWIVKFNTTQAKFKKLLSSLGVNSITQLPQCVYDGLYLYYWFTGSLTESVAIEGVYDFKSAIHDGDWDTVASMIIRNYEFKEQAIECAKIIRLAVYTKTKSRSWLRQMGIFKLRDKNELFKFGTFTTEELQRARFSYYAETQKFLPYTPEGIKRDIINRYAETLTNELVTFDGTTTVYTLQKEPSMYPVEKLEVYVNGTRIQHLFDFTVSGNTLTLLHPEKITLANSELKFVIRI